MFEHLVDFEAEVLDASPKETLATNKVSPAAALDAKINTNDWLTRMGAVDLDAITTPLDTKAARAAFANLVSASPEEITHTALAEIKTPAAVQHLVSMLTAYDWEFIAQAKELRGYTVAKIVEETTNANPSIRLKALTLLGKVTEVGLFTEKIEVKKTDLTDTELDQRIKEKLNRFMQVVDVIDVSAVDEEDAS